MRFLAHLLAAPVQLYRILVSPLLGPHCRFYPSCSTYALQALRAHGAFGGLVLTLKRLMRCHPWSAGGFDPVPPAQALRTHQ